MLVCVCVNEEEAQDLTLCFQWEISKSLSILNVFTFDDKFLYKWITSLIPRYAIMARLVKKPEFGTSIGLAFGNKQHLSQHHSMAGVTLHNLVGTIYYAYALA